MPKFEVAYLSSTYEFFYITADTEEAAKEVVWQGNLTPDITENASWEYCWAIQQEDKGIKTDSGVGW